MNDNRCLVD